MIDATRQAHSAAMLPEYRDRPFDALLADPGAVQVLQTA